MEYNHHKADGVFLAIAFVGICLDKENSLKAARLADALGEREIARNLWDRYDQGFQPWMDICARMDSWETWKAAQVKREIERETDNALLAIALIGAVEAQRAAEQTRRMIETNGGGRVSQQGCEDLYVSSLYAAGSITDTIVNRGFEVPS